MKWIEDDLGQFNCRWYSENKQYEIYRDVPWRYWVRRGDQRFGPFSTLASAKSAALRDARKVAVS